MCSSDLSDVIVNAYFEEPSIETVTLEGNLIKKDYVYGEQFDPNGLTLVYTWSNGQVERIGLEKGAIETVTMDDRYILSTAYGKAIQIKHKEFYPEHPATAYFTTLGITIGAVDENGNGKSKYLTQSDFNDINAELEKIANNSGATVGKNQGIRSDLLKGDMSQVLFSIEGNYKSATEIKNRIDQFASNIRDLGQGVTVYMNIQDASVAGEIQLSLWAVVE